MQDVIRSITSSGKNLNENDRTKKTNKKKG